ncbi:sulfatase [Photobacterium sp. OFAV2-7]|uniref:sulfatase family protein n=1 Tax=Photobacterium sp. OFAV2-7 TaxID=2917748 RepID=UPI001EF57CD5|nr:sulfatase [Photobacterium sp. OFAV2-7]MCG7586869.1 sulfatase [Photobacterium sp. OFAV2-7]
MKRKYLSSVVITLCAAISQPCIAAPQQVTEQPQSPNILLITADDMDYGSLGITGSAVPEISPNLDKLANEGIRFEKAFVTVSVSEPSRGVIATGRYIQNSGIVGFYPTTQPIPTLAEELKENGYSVGILGKLNHSTPKYVDEYIWDYSKDRPQLGDGRSPKLYQQHLTAFIESAKAKNKPFFMMVNSHDPHRPYFVDSPDYEQNGRQRPSRIYRPDEVEVPSFLPDLPGVRTELSQYFSSVKRLDDTVGALMNSLETAGVSDNTIVVFLSDNGISAPFAKSNVYRNSNHTPFFIRWPGKITPDVDDTHYISMVDLMPTLLEATGTNIPESLDGRSFLPLMELKAQTGRDHVFTQYFENAGSHIFPMSAVQNDKWLYIFNPWAVGGRMYKTSANNSKTFAAMKEAAKKDPAIKERVEFFLNRTVTELYDLRNDPDATINLADNPKYQTQQKQMENLMLKQFREFDDPMLELFTKRSDTEYLINRTAEIQVEAKRLKTIHRERRLAKKIEW